MRLWPSVTALPAAINREIGRIIVAYAYLDFCLTALTYFILDVNPKEGRIAVREPRTTDRFDLVCDLLVLNKITISSIDLTAFRTKLECCQRERDQIAHGTWLYDDVNNRLMLRITKGGWRPIRGQKGKTSRRVVPEAIPFEVGDARILLRLIESAISDYGLLEAEVDSSLRSSRRKYPARSQRKNQTEVPQRGK